MTARILSAYNHHNRSGTRRDSCRASSWTLWSLFLVCSTMTLTINVMMVVQGHGQLRGRELQTNLESSTTETLRKSPHPHQASTIPTIQQPQPHQVQEEDLDRLWVGSSAEQGDLRDHEISIVVSHCKGDLSWMKGYVLGLDPKSIYVVSKCGHPPRGKSVPEGKNVKVLELPNVGRVDHTMALAMQRFTRHSDKPKNDKEILVFLKDNVDIHQLCRRRSLYEMIGIAAKTGFACFQEPSDGLSLYHRTDILSLLNMTHYAGVPKYDRKGNKILNDSTGFKSKYVNMGGWLKDMGITLPSPVTAVCYGGMYAVTADRVHAVGHEVWSRIEESLSRADNIEEGHFAERTWAGLLSLPLQKSIGDKLLKKADSIYFHVSDDGGGALGALIASKQR